MSALTDSTNSGAAPMRGKPGAGGFEVGQKGSASVSLSLCLSVAVSLCAAILSLCVG